MNKKFSTICCLVAGAILITGFGFKKINDPWPVPEKYQKMPNPVKADDASVSTGKSLWTKHCASCHGKTGLGDGTKAAKLKTQPGDFSKAERRADQSRHPRRHVLRSEHVVEDDLQRPRFQQIGDGLTQHREERKRKHRAMRSQ